MSVTYTKTDASSLNTDDTNALLVMEVDAKLVDDDTFYLLMLILTVSQIVLLIILIQ